MSEIYTTTDNGHPRVPITNDLILLIRHVFYWRTGPPTKLTRIVLFCEGMAQIAPQEKIEHFFSVRPPRLTKALY